jgi:anaerobic magnesium-protoporphyrin IX monomethyl ester cyclase
MSDKITLVRPPMVMSRLSLSTSTTPPIAIAYLSGTLRADGHNVKTIDALGEDIERLIPIEGTLGIAQGLPIAQIVERIDADTKIIGYSAMFSCSWTYDKTILQRIRERFPNALLVAGGEHITACTEYVLEDCPAIDLCVLGEGEQTLLDIVNTTFAGGDPRTVDGIAFRDNGSVRVNPPRARVRDVDSIPEPDWEDIPLEEYMSRGLGHGVNLGRSMPLLATRGCPYQCTFCSSPYMWTTRWVARSPQEVFDEMTRYIQKYDAENFDLYDLTAIVKKKWIVEFCDIIIKSGLKFTWQLPSGTRAEAIDAEVLDKLWKSGCQIINYAPESGSPAVLDRIKKKVKIPRMLDSMRAAIDRGFSVKINMIFAFPEDTPRDMWKCFTFGVKCAWMGIQDSSFIPYVPYPGSELYLQLVEESKIEPMSDEYFNRLIPHSDLEHAKSFNPYVSDKQLIWIRYLYFMLFYGTTFLRRPGRAIGIVINMLSGKSESRGEESLRTLSLRKKMLKTAA